MKTVAGIAAILAATVVGGAGAASFSVEAGSYVLVDALTGVTIAEKNADDPMQPASLTKMMTAYLIFEAITKGQLGLSDLVVISSRAARVQGYRVGLRAGSEESVRTLLLGMLGSSGNDAALALAEYLAGSERNLVEVMNARAIEMGMTSTKFANVTGMPAQKQYSTARDLATLAVRTITDFPVLYRLYSQREIEIGGQLLRNRNRLLGKYPGLDGLKTGSTRQAGYCLAVSAFDASRAMRLIGVLLKAPSREAANLGMTDLLDYGFANFQTVVLFSSPTQAVGQLPIWGGAVDSIDVGPMGELPLQLLLPRSQAAILRAELVVPEEPLEAPVSKGQRLARIDITAGDEVFARLAAVALRDVAPGDWWKRVADYVRLHWLAHKVDDLIVLQP